ncbi:MAG: ArdC-like ssDNA-binding domain-containing protein [Gemmataceae bacterium]
MNATKEQIQHEALSRAATGQSLSNWPAIIDGFTAKGIPESEILPRENVFTYHAWRALGRQVRRGEHGVRVLTFVACDAKSGTSQEGEAQAKRRFNRPWSATVFHVSQTDPIEA